MIGASAIHIATKPLESLLRVEERISREQVSDVEALGVHLDRSVQLNHHSGSLKLQIVWSFVEVRCLDRSD
jgi:hypothetical protein